ncbi:MAG: patatin-like phospholipase family protein [Ramlibacter sp.]
MAAQQQDNLIPGWVQERRDALRRAANADPAQLPGPQDPLWGLALSGGGIRSATFALGLVSGLAKKGLLHRFDLLSTVSGGGYVGAALGKAYQSAGKDPLEVERRLAEAERSWLVWWLRATSRYLTPRGAPDLLVAAATYFRNMVAVHLELGLAGIAVGAALALFNLAAWQSLARWFADAPDLLRAIGPFLRPWMSTVWLLLVFPLLASVPLTAAYWTILARRGKRRVLAEAAFAMALAILGAIAAWAATRVSAWDMTRDAGLRVFCGGLAVLLLLAATGPLVARLARVGVRKQVPAAPSQLPQAPLVQAPRQTSWMRLRRVLGTTVDTDASAQQRNRLTKALATCLLLAVAVVLLGIIDRLAWFITFERSDATWLLPVIVAAGLAAARTLATQLPAAEASTAVSGRLLFRIADAAGFLLLGLGAIFWVALAYQLALGHLFEGAPSGALTFAEARQLAWVLLALPVLYMVVTCRKADFCNLSSLHMFYRARLTRSYLGAANPHRFPRPPGSPEPTFSPLDDAEPQAVASLPEKPQVFRVDPQDAVALRDYRPHAVGAPVHILNVTINQTREPLGGLFNQDRKGQYLSVTSGGHYRVGLGPWTQDSSITDSQLPAWMAISGAAVAPGLGGQTSAGLSVLLFMSGVRLGYWWEMEPSPKTFRDRLVAWVAPHKYRLLYGEAFAKFGGINDQFWFLSDGGHFENTAAYALLRQRAKLVLVADAAADPRYRYADLENLVRKARIDLGASIEFVDPSSAPRALPAFGTLEQLRDPASDACIALARITYSDADGGWLVFVKPNMFRNLPVDVLNYKHENPAFPQETTADQFFSESQWESYFRLGRELGKQLDPEVLRDLGADAGWTRMLAGAPRTPLRAPAGATPAAETRVAFASRYPRAVSLAKSGLSLTAVVAVLAAPMQVWQKYAEDKDKRVAAYRTELSAATVLHDRVALGDDKPLPELMAKMAMLVTSYCKDGERLVPADDQSRAIYEAVSKRCDSNAKASAACTAFDNSALRCLGGNQRLGQPAYWGIAYHDVPWALGRVRVSPQANQTVLARIGHQLQTAMPTLRDLELQVARWGLGGSVMVAADPRIDETPGAPVESPTTVTAAAVTGPPTAQPTATATATAATAATGATGATGAAPAQATATMLAACKGKLVYLQIYGEEQRADAKQLQDTLAEAGAKAPGIEDVTAAALRSGRATPRPVPAPTVIWHTAAENACADALQQLDGRFVARALAPGLVATPDVLEIWLPPPGSATALVQKLFANTSAERRAAYDELIARHAKNPAIVPQLISYAESHMDNGNGIYNTLVVLSHLDHRALKSDLGAIRAFAEKARSVGPKTAERSQKLLERLPGS